jgi:hypothetical protein
LASALDCALETLPVKMIPAITAPATEAAESAQHARREVGMSISRGWLSRF